MNTRYKALREIPFFVCLFSAHTRNPEDLVMGTQENANVMTGDSVKEADI